jgi:hypothetical protein
MKGILLDENNDLMVRNGTLVIDERTMQDVYIVLRANQGDIKEDPIAGANLLRNLKSKADKSKIQGEIKTALRRIGIEFDSVQQEVQEMINGKKLI